MKDRRAKDLLIGAEAPHGSVSASLLLDSTMDSIFVYRFEEDDALEVIYANRSASETRGYRRDELVGRRLTDILAPGQEEFVSEHLESLIDTGRATFQTRHRRKDGSTFPVEVRVSLFDSTAERIAVAVVRDISDWLSLRSELDGVLQRALAERSQLRTMMDVVPVGMTLVSASGEVLEVNPANEQIWRVNPYPLPAGLEGYSLFKGWDPATGRPYGPSDWPVADVIASGEPVYDRMVEIERFDGSRGTVEISAIPVKDADGMIQSMVALTIDVTDRERRERLALALDDLNLEIHATFDRDRILDFILRRSIAAYEADYGMVLRIDEDESCAMHRSIRKQPTLDDMHPYDSCTHGVYAVRRVRPYFAEDVATNTGVAREVQLAGIFSLVAIPLVTSTGPAFVLELGFSQQRQFDNTDMDFARKVGDFGSFALDNARLYVELSKSAEALAEKDAAIRQAYSDVIEAVTGGRLVILGSDELDEAMMLQREPRCVIASSQQLSSARRDAREKLTGLAFTDDMLLAFGEALNNALKYAGEACYAVNQDDSKVQIIVSDTGEGIDFGNLPKATLMSGFSTTHTLGVGFTLMMELTDRVLLCTDAHGTTVVLERDLKDAGPTGSMDAGATA